MVSQQLDIAHASILDVPVFEDLLAALGNDTDKLRNVYRKFVDGTAARLDTLCRQPATVTAENFHALKGSAGMVGAHRFAAVAARLQEIAADLDENAARAAVRELDAELAAFRQALNAQLDSLPSRG